MASGLWDELPEQNRSICVWVSFREGRGHGFAHITSLWQSLMSVSKVLTAISPARRGHPSSPQWTLPLS